MKVLVSQSCPTLCDPLDCSPLGSSVHGILQARIVEWVAIPFLRGSSWPKDWIHISHKADRFFTVWATMKPIVKVYHNLILKIWKLGCELFFFFWLYPWYVVEKAIATHSSVLSWRIQGTGEPGGLPSMGSHRVGHDWSDLAAAAWYVGSQFLDQVSNPHLLLGKHWVLTTGPPGKPWNYFLNFLILLNFKCY